MKKRIGCIAFSPAGANNMLAMVPHLESVYEVKIFTFHPHAQALFQSDILYTYEELPYILEDETLDLVLTSTGSGGNPIERDTPLLCQIHKIPCISILDCYWMDDENLKMRFVHLPTYITAPNEDIKKRLLTLLPITEQQVLLIGIPHFDRLLDYKKISTATTEKELASFFSTCTTNEELSDTHPKAKLALTELAEWVNKEETIQKVLVTKHPRETDDWLLEFCTTHDKFTFSPLPSWDLLMNSAVVFGLPSTLLYEASMIGKPHCMYQQNGDFLHFQMNTSSEEPMKLYSFEACTHLKTYIDRLLSKKD